MDHIRIFPLNSRYFYNYEKLPGMMSFVQPFTEVTSVETILSNRSQDISNDDESDSEKRRTSQDTATEM